MNTIKLKNCIFRHLNYIKIFYYLVAHGELILILFIMILIKIMF